MLWLVHDYDLAVDVGFDIKEKKEGEEKGGAWWFPLLYIINSRRWDR